MKNMDKWKTPLLILIAIVAVAFIGNQMGLFYVAGGADYSMRSLDTTSYTAGQGDSITISGKAFIKNTYDTTQSYIVVVQPPSTGTQIYKKTVAPGYAYIWSFSAPFTVQQEGKHDIKLYRCVTASCSSKSFAIGGDVLSIDISSGGTTPPPSNGGGGTVPPKPADGCSGTTYVTYTLFGTTWQPQYDYNSASCGYSPPTQPPTPDIPQQPADRCDGTTKVTYSWSGSAWVPASQFNSVDCGYVAPGTGGTTDPTPPAEDSEPVDPIVIVMGSIIVLGGLGAVFMKMKK